MTLLDVRNLGIGYRTPSGLAPAVTDVSFRLDRGRALGLIGESGCGKTTIGMGLLRLLPDSARITSGSILFEGLDLVTAPADQMLGIRGNRISMIFQAAMNSLNPVIRVGEQIAEAILTHGPETSREAAMDEVMSLFRSVDLDPERRFDFPHQFSGGMKQRAVIAMAMACRPDLIIADEPTTALDMVVQRQILTTLDRIRQEQNIAVLMISHDMGVISEVCQEIAVMARGGIVEYGSRDEILTTPAHPLTRALIGAYLSMDREVVLPPYVPSPAPLPIPCPGDPIGCFLEPSCSRGNGECRIQGPAWERLSPTHTVRCRC